MNMIESILTKNPCYTCGKTITIKGLMIHSVGCPQPNASVFVKNWNKSSYNRACVHAFIDAKTGDIYHCLPWNRRGWHAGSGTKGSANNTHIGVEMCEPECIKYTGGSSFTTSDKSLAIKRVQTTYKSAVELFAYLCKAYNLNPLADGVIVSHYEGYKRGIASGHSDPEHLWKGLGLSYTMDGFRKDVYNTMNNNGSSTTDSGTSTPSTTNTKYRVWYGDYASAIAARTDIKKAKNKGLTAIAIKESAAKRYRIQFGVFSSKANATNMLNKVVAAGFSSAYLYPRETTSGTVSPDSPIAKSAINVGDKVKVINAVTYTGKKFKVYYSSYDVIQVSGDRVVIGRGKATTCAINIANIQKI